MDNADCKDTQEVVGGFRHQLPIRLLVERRAGQARGRNAAVRHVSCDYFLWTDDDVTVSTNWLRSYEDAFITHPDAGFFGGPIKPCFEGTPPAWLMPSLPWTYSAFAALDLGDKHEAGRLMPRYLPYGANMAVRAREQQMLTYDENLGRQPGHWLLSGEETGLLHQICVAGGFGVWVSDAGVLHWIDASRQSIAYLRRYFEGIAIVQARNLLSRRPKSKQGISVLWRDLTWSELAYLRGRLLRKPEFWVKALKEASRIRGMLATRREFHRQDGIPLEAKG